MLLTKRRNTLYLCQMSTTERDWLPEQLLRMEEGTVASNDTPVRVIRIGQAWVEHLEDVSVLYNSLSVGHVEKTVSFTVQRKYGKYLCHERADAWLIGLLNWAMRERCDFICESPVTEELLYNIRRDLLPALHRNGPHLHLPQITAETSHEPLDCALGVGTGCSCGIDSLHAISRHMDSDYPNLRLTHVTLNNVGAFTRDGATTQSKRDFHIQLAQQLSEELGLELIITDSNFADAFPQNHFLTHTYSSCFAIYAMRKLWKTYYYASTGYAYESFTLDSHETKSCPYELLSLNAFSVPSLRIYSEGGAHTRYEKTAALIHYKPAQQYLNVCTETAINCGRCPKCKRTMLTLDCLGALDLFTEVFPIDEYKKWRKFYIKDLYRTYRKQPDKMMLELYNILSKELTLYDKLAVMTRPFRAKVKSFFKK